MILGIYWNGDMHLCLVGQGADMPHLKGRWFKRTRWLMLAVTMAPVTKRPGPLSLLSRLYYCVLLSGWLMTSDT